MEDDVRQRVRLLLKEKSISLNVISKDLDYPQSNLNKQINGDTAISLRTLLVLLDYFPEVSTEWLLRGYGDMIKSSEPQHLDEHDELIKLRAENNLLRDIVGLKELQNKNVG